MNARPSSDAANAVADDDPKVLAMTSLGKFGRFGNSIFQYAFLKICARASGAEVQTAPWVGNDLFGHHDPPVTASLGCVIEDGATMNSLLDTMPELVPFLERTTRSKARYIGVEAMTEGGPSGNVFGLFQWHSSAYRPHKEYFRSLFQPSEDLRPWLDEPITEMRKRGRTIVALHLRTGDYHWLPMYTWTLMPPPQWWAEWLASVWKDLDDPVLYLCSNDVGAIRSWFKEFNPVTSDDFPTAPPGRLKGMSVEFFRDFHVLTQADVLGISNSTFSFAAAMLNERATRFVRPHWDFSTRFTDFDPWDAQPLLALSAPVPSMHKGYRRMLRVARETGGIKGAIASALLYHPVGSAAVLKIRLGLAFQGRGWRGVRDHFLRRRPPAASAG